MALWLKAAKQGCLCRHPWTGVARHHLGSAPALTGTAQRRLLLTRETRPPAGALPA